MTDAKRAALALAAAGLPLLPAAEAWAQDAAAPDSGNTAWVLTSTALVLFMTMPGLALFYGGLVRSGNVLSVLMHCFSICCLVSILWFVGAYSLAFTDGGGLNAVVGGLGAAFLGGAADAAALAPGLDIPETAFFMFQMTFAIIAPALIVGAYVERIRFSAVLLFSGAWSILVYAPVCHWVWGGGWLAELGVQDFAGGLVVHLTCGTSALVLAWVLGSRAGFPREIRPPHNPGMVMMGAAMLWVGWFGFNAGSAVAADGAAAMAMAVTHISAATAAFTWMVVEWVRFRKPTLVGIATGAIAGLATITPASGFVGPVGALVIGIAAGLVCFYAVGAVKNALGVDDSLDVMAVHGVGGAMGVLLTAVFGAAAFGGLGLSDRGIGGQLGTQAIGVAAVLAWSAMLTFVIAKAVNAIAPLRAEREAEIEGLDLIDHGEKGYDL